ncbi:MAG: hypothetical protein JXQ23_14310 [Clostridia bacterium]|nr:hypothetical protein [Clostridia bacterium]
MKKLTTLLSLFLTFTMIISVLTGCSLLKRNKVEEKPEYTNAIDKIRQRYEEGEISREEAAVMTVQAAYFPEQLPKEYASDPNDEFIFEINDEWCYITENWNDLSEETKKELRPYYLEPDDPSSYFNLRNDTSELSFTDFFRSRKVNAEEEYPPLHYSTSSHENIVTIYYYNPNASADVNNQMKAKALLVLETVQKAWPMYRDLLGIEPSLPFDVYLTHIPNQGLWGEARWQNQPLKYWINIRKTLDVKTLQATAAHELFHIFQYEYAPYYRTNGLESDWIKESTATWAMHYVYPDYNIEHVFIPRFFNNIEKERISNFDKRNYANYLFVLFLTQYTGRAEIVKDLIEKCKSGDIVNNIPKAIDSYESTFSQFALYGWDKDPFEAFMDIPSFPHQGAGNSACEEFYLTEKTETKAEELLSPGGCNYHTFYIDSDEIDKVVFDFSETEKNSSIRKQAMIKINGVWTREDWSELSSRTFCRSKPEEKIEQVIIAWGNADLTSAYSIKYKVDTKEACEVEKAGFMRITQTLTVNGLLASQAVLESREVLELVQDEYISGNPYKIAERTMTFSYSYHWKTEFESLGVQTGSTTALSELTESYEQNEDQPVRMVITPDGKIRLTVFYDNTSNSEWVVYQYSLTTANITQNWTETGAPVIQDYGYFDYDFNESDIRDHHIKGTESFDIDAEGGSLHTKVEFDYYIP